MKQDKRSFPIGTLVLSILVLVGLVLIITRYLNGLGATTNLSDGQPWGLYIGVDASLVAISAGGFVLAAAAYIFGREKYHSIIRPAILTAFVGYITFVLVLLVEIGQPWYFWRVFYNWNVHSPLFEVIVCVTIYTTVLVLELSPAVFERFNLHVPLRIIRAIQIPLVIAGIVLSTLHQSSLGSMLLLMPESVHALWYTPMIPLLFLTSAIAVGAAMVIFSSSLSSKAFGHKLGTDVLIGLGKAIVYILGIYLILKLVDLGVGGELSLVFTAYPQNLLWWGEVIIGIILPILLLLSPGIRQSRRGIFWSSVLVIIGVIFNRFNAYWFSWDIRPGFTYTPHWIEYLTTIGLLAITTASPFSSISFHRSGSFSA